MGQRGPPDYERGQWTPLDLMTVRDAAVADIVPKMSEIEGYGNTNNPRLIPYNLGHALFEFIEAKLGKEGIRQFMFALRKSVIGGGEDAYEEAFKMKKDEFDQAFERYLKDRFKPFRDKERPADYGRDLAPNKEKTELRRSVVDRALALRRSDRGRHDQPQGPRARHRAPLGQGRLDRPQPDERLRQGHGLRPHRAARRTLEHDAVDVVVAQRRPPRVFRAHRERAGAHHPERAHAKIEERIPMKSVDEPESPSFSPDGRTIAFAALRGAVGDIYTIDLETKQVVNLTNDDFADYAPSYSPDGKYIIYNARVSGNQKLFRLDLDTKKKTQLTFGTQDETSAQFIDDHTIVFSSTATDPAVPLEPEVAKNGNIYNIWTLDLQTGELRQYTDALGGNWSAVVLNEGQTKPHRVHQLLQGRVQHPHARAQGAAAHGGQRRLRRAGPDHRFPGAAPAHAREGEQRKKKPFEKMFLEGARRSTSASRATATSSAARKSASATCSAISSSTSSPRRSRSTGRSSLSYVNLSRRFQFALQGYSQTQFFYGQLGGVFYDPA